MVGPLGDKLIISVLVDTIADKQWHYTCADLSLEVKNSAFSKYTISTIKVDKVIEKHIFKLQLNK